MSTEVIHIAGRYNKYLRNLSQSPWYDKNDARVLDSVQELLEDGLKKYLNYDKSTFASSGREDVDVRMLGKGRPFVFKLHNLKNMANQDENFPELIQKYINEQHSGKVSVRDLQFVDKNVVSKYLKEGQEFKQKEYRALCCCSRKLTADDYNKINEMSELRINQTTPIRVLHRRTWAVRQRTIHRLKLNAVKLNEFDHVKPEYIDNVFTLTLLTEAGTYIKEFVHGDFGRTEPSMSTLLGDCDTDLMELDVMEVHADWPPAIDDKRGSKIDIAASMAHQESKMDCSDEALAELYSNGLQALTKALETERGDKKDSLLVDSRRSLEKAARMVESLALFSDNETLEDIATINLKYLLIPAHLAKISISGDFGSRRLEAFTQAETLIHEFLLRVSNLNIGDCDRVKAAIGALNAEPNQISTQKSIEDQLRTRAEKIERYNEAKELNARLAELERRLESGQEVDDEIVREHQFSLINKWINETLDDLDGIVRPGLIFERGSSSTRQDPPKRAQAADSLVGKNFVITKDQLKKQVFGSGYPSLPTVSVDEFITKKIKDGDLAFESQKGIYANSLQRYAEKPDLRREQEEQSDEEREGREEREDLEELARKRQWDQFKDENPRGSGNRHNMG